MPDGAVSLESNLCTKELPNRPWRPPGHEKENSALVALTSALADSPRTILQTLADKVLEVLRLELVFEKVPGGRGGYNRWTINGKSWPAANPLFTTERGTGTDMCPWLDLVVAAARQNQRPAIPPKTIAPI
jgi:hypothetical protein